MKRGKDAEEFCKYIAHEYFGNRNYELVGELIDNRISVIGTGAHEISRNIQEFAGALKKEEAMWDGSFIIEREWYQATRLANNIFVVIGEVEASQNSTAHLIYRFSSRVTFVVEYDDNWKLIHVHQSVPDLNQGDEEFFPHRMIEESKVQLEKQIAQKTKELEMSNKQVIYNLRHDYLTGILNRHYLEVEIKKAMKEYKYGVILVFDIDFFKKVNDGHGHLFGDKVLIKLADTMKDNFKVDYCGRIGGDEFIAYIPLDRVDYQEVEKIVDKFRMDWQNNIKDIYPNDLITLSIGLAFYPMHGKEYQELLDNGDKALYMSKNSGRNQVTIYQDRAVPK